MKEERRRKERGKKKKEGREDIRTDADEGEKGKKKICGRGEEGEILIWRGKREKPTR